MIPLEGIQPNDKPKPRNHGLLGRTVAAKPNSYRESSLEFSIIIIFSPIPLQRPTQTELRDEVPVRGEDCHNSPFQVIFRTSTIYYS